MTRPRLLLVLAFAVAASPPASAEPASPWIGDGASRIRLVDAGLGPAPGVRLAGIEIALDPGWKTYWRQPGASGAPPRFDFSGSRNVAEVAVAYPVPERQADDDGVVNVYHDEVMLPVTVRAREPSAPIELRLAADYGVCEAVCVPVHSEAGIDLAPGGGAEGPAGDAARREAARAPKPAALGAAGPLAVASVVRVAPEARGGAALEIAVKAPEGETPLLFAETGDGDFAPAPEPLGASAGGGARFRMAFDEAELPPSGLRLTLAAGSLAVETPVALDAIGPKP